MTLRTGAASEGQSPRGSASPTKDSVREAAPSALPARAVDEGRPFEWNRRSILTTDYDEGAADALMFLHSATSPPNSMAGNKRPASPTSPPNTKKARPDAVNRLTAAPPPGTGRNGSASPAKRQVIEVLNTPSISSPVPRPTSGSGFEAPKKDVDMREEGRDDTPEHEETRARTNGEAVSVEAGEAAPAEEEDKAEAPNDTNREPSPGSGPQGTEEVAQASAVDSNKESAIADPAVPAIPIVRDVQEDQSSRDADVDVMMDNTAPPAATVDASSGVAESAQSEGTEKAEGESRLEAPEVGPPSETAVDQTKDAKEVAAEVPVEDEAAKETEEGKVEQKE